PKNLLSYLLSGYKFTAYKSQPPSPNLPHPTLHLPNTPPSTIKEAQNIARAIYLTRTLINTPAEDCNPEQLQRVMEGMAETAEASTCKTWVGEELTN
ncbi:hypothetical protein TrRE_jg1164, partial [Triparma retinervis]